MPKMNAVTRGGIVGVTRGIGVLMVTHNFYWLHGVGIGVLMVMHNFYWLHGVGFGVYMIAGIYWQETRYRAGYEAAVERLEGTLSQRGLTVERLRKVAKEIEDD
jgi:hypothetical protein